MARFGKMILIALVLLPLVGVSLTPTPTRARPNGTSATAPVGGTCLEKVTTAVIDGMVGGELKNSKWTVIVPAGAYHGTATVTMVVKGLDQKTVELGIVPEGLNHFLVPVKLQYKKADASENLANESIYWWNPETRAWEPAPNQSGDVVNGTLMSGLLHFSTYRVLGGRAGW